MPTSETEPAGSGRRLLLRWLVPVGAALLLALVFWGPLWRGGGFVGGDVYSYYFPQKVFYSAALQEGRLPLWNSWTGHGYPIVGESQTGVFYPFNMLLYGLLPVHAAYNASWLLHFCLAFVFTWLVARRLGLSRTAAMLAALVYSCGWFPTRTSWEWSVTTGAWLPLAVWCAECFIETGRWRYAVGLALVTGVQLLAGHYHLAFLTILLLAGYVPLRLWWVREEPAASGIAAEAGTGGPVAGSAGKQKKILAAVMLLVAATAGYSLAAVQLLPSLELLLSSQRAETGEEHNLRHGAMPAWYWTQAVAPWHWYLPSVPRDQLLQQWAEEYDTKTNQIEAHLYFGILPLLLCGLAAVSAVLRRDRRRLVWVILGVTALCCTPGWLVPLTQYLPGFSFFQGPGRNGLLTTFCVGLLAGFGLDDVRQLPNRGRTVALLLGVLYSTVSLLLLYSETADLYREAGLPVPFSLWGVHLSSGPVVLVLQVSLGFILVCGVRLLFGLRLRPASVSNSSQRRSEQSSRLPAQASPALNLLLVLGLVLTAGELWLVSRLVTYSPLVDDPPLVELEHSFIREELAKAGAGARLSAPYMNLPAVFGAGTVNPYFTFGPAEYADPKLRMPGKEQYPELSPAELEKKQIEWMQRAGVTHILSLEPMDETAHPVKLVREGIDPVFNPALGRYRQPVYLYQLNGGRSRVFAAGPAAGRTSLIHLLADSPERIEADISTDSAGLFVLTELKYHGWQVEIDGDPAKLQLADGMFQAVQVPAGEHRVVFFYNSIAVRLGARISLGTFVLLALVAHLKFWHPQLFTGRRKEAVDSDESHSPAV